MHWNLHPKLVDIRIFSKYFKKNQKVKNELMMKKAIDRDSIALDIN